MRNDKAVGEEQPTCFLLVDDVHLQGEHHSGFVYQPALFTVEIAVLGALGAIGADLGFVARVGAEHVLQIATRDIIARIMNELARRQRVGAGFARQ